MGEVQASPAPGRVIDDVHSTVEAAVPRRRKPRRFQGPNELGVRELSELLQPEIKRAREACLIGSQAWSRSWDATLHDFPIPALPQVVLALPDKPQSEDIRAVLVAIAHSVAALDQKLTDRPASTLGPEAIASALDLEPARTDAECELALALVRVALVNRRLQSIETQAADGKAVAAEAAVQTAV
eukprot:c1535_g1_i1.p1 GENE.c1535_g1_i1~~c1535_g1_i1.p1  ORF type:complete len:185 (+),score=14.36 c1535_g1_i1:95-649(+)